LSRFDFRRRGEKSSCFYVAKIYMRKVKRRAMLIASSAP
jgi:hypothetical protein